MVAGQGHELAYPQEHNIGKEVDGINSAWIGACKLFLEITE